MQRELAREIAEHKKRMEQMRRDLQQQLAKMGYHTRTPADAERLARRLGVKQ